MTQKTREQLEELWLTHFEPTFPPNYSADSDDERAMALLIDKMSEKLKDPDFIILRKEYKEEVEELKTKLNEIELNTRNGCLGHFYKGCAWLVGVFILFAVFAYALDTIFG